MRALNVHSFRLEEIHPNGDSPPTYAILSHRWENDIRDEVLYEDFRSVEHDPSHQGIRQKRGFAKVDGACKQAARDGYTHIWIDSCCINQSSSAELSESINSMYRFYEEAQVCYAFLAGLPPDVDPETDESFERHEWFTRGWTLQELIAPTNMFFFTDKQVGQHRTSDWVCLAAKAPICRRLAAITKIDADVLSHKRQVGQVSVAKRMSWAARRVTTKPEDRAYSLMGLFDVNMPMIYGEGKTKAFLRLQEEIMKVSSDQSIFAWCDADATPGARTGILATAPEMFKDSGSFFGYHDWDISGSFTKTNLGLQITLPLRPHEPDTFVASLNCPQAGESHGFAGIYLRHAEPVDKHNPAERLELYERVQSGKLAATVDPADRGTNTPILVRDSGARARRPIIYPVHVLQLGQGPDPGVDWELYGTMGCGSPAALKLDKASWIAKPQHRAFELPKEPCRLVAVFVFERPDKSKVTVLLGSGAEVEDVGVQILEGYRDQTLREWAQHFSPEAVTPTQDRPRDLGRELVSVEITRRVYYSHRYYVADIIATLNPSFEDEEDKEDKEAPGPPSEAAGSSQKLVRKWQSLVAKVSK